MALQHPRYRRYRRATRTRQALRRLWTPADLRFGSRPVRDRLDAGRICSHVRPSLGGSRDPSFRRRRHTGHRHRRHRGRYASRPAGIRLGSERHGLERRGADGTGHRRGAGPELRLAMDLRRQPADRRARYRSNPGHIPRSGRQTQGEIRLRRPPSPECRRERFHFRNEPARCKPSPAGIGRAGQRRTAGSLGAASCDVGPKSRKGRRSPSSGSACFAILSSHGCI